MGTLGERSIARQSSAINRRQSFMVNWRSSDARLGSAQELVARLGALLEVLALLQHRREVVDGVEHRPAALRRGARSARLHLVGETLEEPVEERVGHLLAVLR